MHTTTIARASRLSRRIAELPFELRRSISTAIRPEIYDIVCIGGGPAGLSLLTALKSHPSAQHLKIALIDGQAISTIHPSDSTDIYSNRCSSLTPKSIAFLQQIGAWDHIKQSRIQYYHRMDVWDGISGSKISFDPSEKSPGILDTITQAFPMASRSGGIQSSGQSNNVVAAMCENINLTSGLLKTLQKLPDVEIIESTKVSSIELGPEAENENEGLNLSQWPVVTLPSGRSLAARLLIGADGANSPVRSFAGIPAHGWDYAAHGVVATVSTNHTFDSYDHRTAFQRFLPTGPIALLPLPDNKATLVWSTKPHIAAVLKALPKPDFIAMVNAAFRLLSTDLAYIYTMSNGQADEVSWREGQTDSNALGLPSHLPRIVDAQDGSIAAFPLRLRHADTYTGHRVALIGDAAHTIHPLAGQGLNLGQADAEALSQRIISGIETGMDIGTSWCLDGYNSDRWAANNAVMGVCDKLNKLYSTDSAPVVAARSLGLGLVDRLGPLKGLIMGAAAG